jgi:hypothetical protein
MLKRRCDQAMKLRLACLALTALSMSVAACAQSRPHAHGASDREVLACPGKSGSNGQQRETAYRLVRLQV